MSGRPWTPEEDRVLRKHFGKLSARAIAEKIGRTMSSVYQRADRLGITSPRDQASINRRKARLPELLAKGWSDAEIAAALGMPRRSLTDMRNRMGLPGNGWNERARKRVAANAAKQFDSRGVKSLAELRSQRMKEAARKLGWPDKLSARSVQIIETLYQRGPMTRRQITAAIGLPWLGSRKSLRARVPGGSYMAELQRAGLVARLPGAITHKGKGSNEDLYMVALEVEPCPIKQK